MNRNVVQGTHKLADAIRKRRTELNLTIEEAAYRAGVGIKTWCRYESGESIRQDKAKGVCKALNWHSLPGADDKDDEFDFDEYKNHEAWSESICDRF
ncbi:MAG: helix-turn-helix domain-containing protein, partial [Candidatus Fimadaptatus sp.]